jgi:phosphatidylserine/phosphatidylglycerophosphate/cardiolipin synthase-like enzyme
MNLDWFLPAPPPDSAEAWCFQVVPTVEIRVHTTFMEYTDRLFQLMVQLSENDEYFQLAWDFDLSLAIGPALPKGLPPPMIFRYMYEGARRGARVRVLASGGGQNREKNDEHTLRARDFKIQAYNDNQLPSGTSHHQKAVYMKLRKANHVFVGGVDLEVQRHKWFDVQAEIIGQGAALGRRTFEERWNSVLRSSIIDPFPLRPVVVSTSEPANHHVQFLRTYPPFPNDKSGWTRTYAPLGDHTYYALISRALKRVKSKLYIEEQFLYPMQKAPAAPGSTSGERRRSDVPDIPDTLENLLVAAVSRGVHVVIVVPHKSSVDVNAGYRNKVIQALKNVKKGRVDILQVRAGMLFVHSKTWIFDDEFVVIGSANFWANSFVSVSHPAESEFGVGFVSSIDGSSLQFKGESFARALRIRLWERIKQTIDFNYIFPRRASASFQEEVAEFKSKIGDKETLESL